MCELIFPDYKVNDINLCGYKIFCAIPDIPLCQMSILSVGLDTISGAI